MGGVIVDTNTPTENLAQCCFQHDGEESKLYCETCSDLICYQCIMKGGKHHDHNYVLLKIAFEKCKEEIISSLEPIEKQVTIIKKALAELNTRHGEISNQRASVKNNIHVTFRQLREVLTVRETELITQVHQMTQAKLKGLAAQSDQIETTLAQLNSCLHFMKENLSTANESDMLVRKANTVQQAKELTIQFQEDTLIPNAEADILFTIITDLTAMCQDYGLVLESGLPNYFITGGDAKVAAVGKKSTALLQAINIGGKPCEELIESFECELASEITGIRASCTVDRKGQSPYEVSYQPTIKGRHQLCITVEGHHVRGSPLYIGVRSQVEKLGAPILTIGGVQGPWGVAINQKREVVVTERAANCLVPVEKSFGHLARVVLV